MSVWEFYYEISTFISELRVLTRNSDFYLGVFGVLTPYSDFDLGIPFLAWNNEKYYYIGPSTPS